MPALMSKFLAQSQRFPAICLIFKRHGHGRVLMREANRTTWIRLKDHVHFYLLLGIFIWGGFTFTVNTLFGQCQLVDTPDDYEPRYWEYERHPIQQLITKYSPYPTAYAGYEQRLALLDELNRNRIWAREEDRARRLMYERQDYKAWYHVPYYVKWLEWSRNEWDRWKYTRPEFTHDRET